jgi:LPPG:FO 2-phospho-L-lactate transferase
MRVTVLAGGYGGAKLSHGLDLESAKRVAPGSAPIALDIIVNTGDDLLLHGLHVSPDLDTVMYTLAGLANDQTGWGVRDETWSAAGQLERYGAATWFRLGDRDLATHIHRTELLREGVPLTAVTLQLSAALGVKARLLPMSDQPVRTELLTDDGWLEFQDYFVRRGHRDEVREIRQLGIDAAHPTADVFDAIRAADLIVFAPSNPFVSIGTILALRGATKALTTTEARIVAVSPIVAGEALRGPADQMLVSLGGEASAKGVAAHYVSRYPGLLDAFVIDTADAGAAAAIEALGLEVLVTGTVMRDHEDRRWLAAEILDRFAPTGG